MVIEPALSVIELKLRIAGKYNEQNPEDPLDPDTIRIRNPKSEGDFGELLNDCDILENCHLYDEKELFVSKQNKDRQFDFVNKINPDNSHYILFREWDGETWELGPVYEVRVDKSISGTRLGKLLSESVFPHIPSESLFVTKIAFVKNFKRGDLAVRNWNTLKNQSMWLGQTSIQINRDGVFVVVRDSSKKIREELTEQELLKWASNGFLDHLQKKKVRMMGFNNHMKDGVFIASQNNQPDFKKLPKMQEKGIKI